MTSPASRPSLYEVSEVDVLHRLFDAYNRDDVDGVVADATDDVEYGAAKRGVRVHGRDN